MTCDLKFISIIIPTRNQEKNLREALLSIKKMKYPEDKFEVIVIDDHSFDNTVNMLEQLKSDLEYDLKYQKLEDKTGISAARNLGTKLARGELLVFTDDDCLFEPNWLKLLSDAAQDEDTGAIGGPDKTPSPSGLLTKCIGYIFTSFIGTGGLRRGNKARLGKYYPKGCNITIPAIIFKKIGYFDEYLQPAEEIELGYRISKAGYKIKYLPEAFVWHKRRSSLKSYLKKMFGIGYIRIVLTSRHKDLFQLGHFIPFLGLMIILLMLILSIINPLFLILPIFMTSVYFILILISSIIAIFVTQDVRVFFILILLFPLHHLTHALGISKGILDYLINPAKLYPYFNPEFKDDE